MDNERRLIRYRHEDIYGLMHYVVFEKDFVVLSELKTLKAKFIDKHGYLEITFDVNSTDFNKVKAEVVTDLDYVKRVYDYMIETNNAYFTQGYESLCAIKIR